MLFFRVCFWGDRGGVGCTVGRCGERGRGVGFLFVAIVGIGGLRVFRRGDFLGVVVIVGGFGMGCEHCVGDEVVFLFWYGIDGVDRCV